MSTREILTLQFGHYSNFIGTHFWNLQELNFDYTGVVKEECNHDILYREGQTPRGEVTYTPRLLLADLKGSLRSFPVSGGLPIEESTENLPWDTIEKIEEPAIPKNEFLENIDSECPTSISEDCDLDNSVKTWTDYLYPRFHPRTVNIVKEYDHGNDSTFDVYMTGQNIWKSEYGENFADNIRKYTEECDSMQGFQVNFDCTDAFSGLALSCTEYLCDEYAKSILVHPIIASHFPDNNPQNEDDREKSTLKDSMRLVNIALSIERLSQYATFFVPLCTSEKGWRKPGNPRPFEYLNYNPELYYHSSAILASAIDTLSQKYRHISNSYTISDICADMTGYGRKMGAASLGLPFAMKESDYLIEHLNNVTKPLYTSITPSCKIATDKIFQIVTVRGLPESYLKAPPKEANKQQNLAAYRCNSIKEMFELYLQSTNFLSATNVEIVNKPINLKTPFPKIFSENLNRYGLIKNDIQQEPIESVPAIACYHNGNFMADMIEKLHREVSRIKFTKLHKFKEEGLEAAEFKESLDLLAEFKDNYEDNFEL
ncbi:Protein misato [Eumeta japonica]|uniref:Protein misato n=1 Tax=Eumeta variegata TaxID=151549 RepID=A0A4C1XJK9_EUMVA|nr:Protein misato [Eumeta japonica]